MKIVILAHDVLLETHGKTARGVYYYSPHKIVAIVDRAHGGMDASQLLGGRSVKIYHSLGEIKEDYDALLIGSSPIGGKMPEEWRDEIKLALSQGKNVISGLHDFLSEDEEFRKIAERSGAKIWDVRKPPRKMHVADGSGRFANTVLVAGTDCAVGKMITAIQLTRDARKRGINAGFIATGQTGIMIGADAGVVIDRVPGDFMAGVMEEMVKEVAKKRDVIFVEGQGSLSHPAYSGVTLAILHGSYPKKIIIAHDPKRVHHFGYPDFKIPPLKWHIEMHEKLSSSVSGGKVVGIAIDGERMSDEEIEKYKDFVENEYDLPAEDVFHNGAERLLKAVL